MKTLLLAGLLSCFSIGAFAKSTDVVIGDCTDSNMAIIVDAARGAGETVPAVDSQPMRNMRDNLSQVCASIYQQGQTARGLKGITYTADQARVSMKAAIMANMKWFTEFGHLNRGDMLTSEQHRCSNEKKKF